MELIPYLIFLIMSKMIHYCYISLYFFSDVWLLFPVDFIQLRILINWDNFTKRKFTTVKSILLMILYNFWNILKNWNLLSQISFLQHCNRLSIILFVEQNHNIGHSFQVWCNQKKIWKLQQWEYVHAPKFFFTFV